MPTWLQNILIAISGGSVVLAGVLTIFRNLFFKLFEASIETTFERKMEKYRNRLTRSTKAYEMLLTRELQFYEKSEQTFSELARDIQDMYYYLEANNLAPHNIVCSSYSKHLDNYVNLVRSFRGEAITYQPYYPESIAQAFIPLGTHIQDTLPFWLEAEKQLLSGNSDGVDLDKGKEIVDAFLQNVVVVGESIRDRLDELSKL